SSPQLLFVLHTNSLSNSLSVSIHLATSKSVCQFCLAVGMGIENRFLFPLFHFLGIVCHFCKRFPYRFQSRTDLGKENVFFYQDQKFIPDDQHSSFKNRVDLQDRQMKHGDVSLILNNVTINDTGTYMCCVFMKGAKHRRRAKLDSDLISVVNLHVVRQTGGDTEDGVIRYKVIYFVLFLVPALVAVILICKKKNKNNPPLPTPLTDEVGNEVY
uniref:Immunoglobulin V-set domain-containing protein n=1 Tax=Maylandia zebra TaxID=106582 RepID=A0A3P9D888_9CICH